MRAAFLSTALLASTVTTAIGADVTGCNADAERLQQLVMERDRQYSQRFEAQERAASVALAAQERYASSIAASAKEATDKALMSIDSRLASVNEFRAQLKDQTATFIPRPEMESRLKVIDDGIKELSIRQYQNLGRGEGASQLWGIIIGVAGILVASLAVFISSRPRAIKGS